jgi:hypothetical protein
VLRINLKELMSNLVRTSAEGQQLADKRAERTQVTRQV